MRVFVTGASGHIGSAVVPELLAAGHEVVGLARSDSSATALVAAGAAVEAIGEALEGSGKPFVVTSGTLLLARAGLGRAGTENDTLPGGPRIDSENATIAMAERGVRSSVIRLSPLVHSTLDHHGFTHRLIDSARSKGVSGYIGDGSNRWPALHTLDAAHLYRLALESAPPGSRLHGVGDEGVPFRDIAEVIGRHLGLRVASIAPDRAGDNFGFLGALVGLDNPTSSQLTRELLGWQPTHPGLIEDLDQGHYFGD